MYTFWRHNVKHQKGDDDEGSIWSNKAFSNGVLNILRHALRARSVELLKANNASYFLPSPSRGTSPDGSDQLGPLSQALLGAASPALRMITQPIHGSILTPSTAAGPGMETRVFRGVGLCNWLWVVQNIVVSFGMWSALAGTHTCISTCISMCGCKACSVPSLLTHLPFHLSNNIR